MKNRTLKPSEILLAALLFLFVGYALEFVSMVAGGLVMLAGEIIFLFWIVALIKWGLDRRSRDS